METDPPVMVQLDDYIWMHYNHIHFLGDNNITEPLQKGGRGADCFTAEETSCNNSSIIFLEFYEVTLHTEGNECGFIAVTIIKIKFFDGYIHILSYLSKEFICGPWYQS